MIWYNCNCPNNILFPWHIFTWLHNRSCVFFLSDLTFHDRAVQGSWPVGNGCLSATSPWISPAGNCCPPAPAPSTLVSLAWGYSATSSSYTCSFGRRYSTFSSSLPSGWSESGSTSEWSPIWKDGRKFSGQDAVATSTLRLSLYCYEITYSNSYSQWQQSQLQTNKHASIFYYHLQHLASHQISQRHDS